MPKGLKATLGTHRECFVEIVSGPMAGHCFDLDEMTTTDTQSVIEQSNSPTQLRISTDLEGSRVVVRAHWSLGDLMPASRFHGTGSASTADRVLFFENGAYVVTCRCWRLGMDRSGFARRIPPLATWDVLAWLRRQRVASSRLVEVR